MNLKYFATKFLLLIIVLFTSFISFSSVVYTKAPDLNISDKSFAANYVSQSIKDPIELEAGSTKTVQIKFKNTGSKAWRPGSRNFVSAYTVDSKYRKSKFANDQWRSNKQTAKISEVVKPGEVGTLSIKLKAPNKPGEYKEKFYLAAENHTWIQGGYFYFDLNVTLPSRTPGEKEKKISDPKPKISYPNSYKANFISQSLQDPIQLEAGTSKKVTVKFRNKGNNTWRRSGSNFVSVYTMKPKYNKSEFVSDTWVSPKRPTKIDKSAGPNEVGKFSFELSAPNTTGRYIEHFYLASENTSWIKGGYFYLKLDVVASDKNSNTDSKKGQKTEPPKSSPPEDSETKNKEKSDEQEKEKPQAQKVLINKQKIKQPGGNQSRIIMAILNKSGQDWKNYSIRPVSNTANFADDSWQSRNKILQESKKTLDRGIIREEFFVRTPSERGSYKLNFAVFTDGKKIPGTTFEVPVEVTENASETYSPPFDQEQEKKNYRMEQQPKIKIGLKSIDNNYNLFTPLNSAYKVFAGKELKGVIKQNETATLSKEGKDKYFFGMEGLKFETEKYLRLVPKSDYSSKFKLTHFEREVPWRDRNFNIYRGSLQYRKEKEDEENIYLINKLKLEDYVKGIGETSENPPLAMQKAQAVAARTYAMHIRDTAKHSSRNFHLSGGTGDQLYLGVKSEKLSPKYVKAAEATRGQIVTYENEIVTTPYFGHSNGYTRSWADVWGGDQKPWLVPVRTEYDAGLSTYGHGVGMSQRDAAIRARKEDASWRELINHYYTDIEIERFYK
jgi:hypothetical protein